MGTLAEDFKANVAAYATQLALETIFGKTTVQGQKKEAIEAFRSYLRTRESPTHLDKEIERLIEQLERSPQS